MSASTACCSHTCGLLRHILAFEATPNTETSTPQLTPSLTSKPCTSFSLFSSFGLNCSIGSESYVGHEFRFLPLVEVKGTLCCRTQIWCSRRRRGHAMGQSRLGSRRRSGAACPGRWATACSTVALRRSAARRRASGAHHALDFVFFYQHLGALIRDKKRRSCIACPQVCALRGGHALSYGSGDAPCVH